MSVVIEMFWMSGLTGDDLGLVSPEAARVTDPRLVAALTGWGGSSHTGRRPTRGTITGGTSRTGLGNPHTRSTLS